MPGPCDRPSRVLVIDNDPAIHDAIHEMLGARQPLKKFRRPLTPVFEIEPSSYNGAPYRIECTSQAGDGLALLGTAVEDSEPFDVAFVDVCLPLGGTDLEMMDL